MLQVTSRRVMGSWRSTLSAGDLASYRPIDQSERKKKVKGWGEEEKS